MRVEWKEDSMGNLISWPVSATIRAAFKSHMQEFGSEHADGSVFINEGNTAEVIEDFIPARKRGDLAHGWTVATNVDPWTWAHLLGWDAHTVVEAGLI